MVPDEMARAAEIVALRALGLSLAQVARVLEGDAQEPGAGSGRAPGDARRPGCAISPARWRRSARCGPTSLAARPPAAGELARLLAPPPNSSVAFDLPWPWGGERFELQRHPAAELHHRPARQRQDAAGAAAGRDPARMPPSSAWSGWRMVARSAGASRRRPGPQVAGRSGPRLARRGRRAGRRRPWSPCWSGWNRKARPSWSSTCWSRGWTRPPRRP